MVHGQVGGVAVVNDQETGIRTFPARSAAPLTAAVYVTPVASAPDGVNVAFFAVESYATVPDPAVPLPSLRDMATVLGCTASLNVAVTPEPVETPAAPEDGRRP